VAQAPVKTVSPGAVTPLPVGATMVKLSVATRVVLAPAGHDVVSQSRPVWQQPPW
jgi:hypothetical protein